MSVAHCTLREGHNVCPVCDRACPDVCGQLDLPLEDTVEAPAEVTEDNQEDTGGDMDSGDPEAVSEAPKGVTRRKRR